MGQKNGKTKTFKDENKDKITQEKNKNEKNEIKNIKVLNKLSYLLKKIIGSKKLGLLNLINYPIHPKEKFLLIYITKSYKPS